jgi:hypothetical protein
MEEQRLIPRCLLNRFTSIPPQTRDLSNVIGSLMGGSIVVLGLQKIASREVRENVIFAGAVTTTYGSGRQRLDNISEFCY